MPFAEGYLAGLAMIVFVGPVLFVLLHSTLDRGRAHGFATAFGIFVSDIIAALLLTIGFAKYFEDPTVQFWMALTGGVLVSALGLRNLLSCSVKEPRTRAGGGASLVAAFGKGFSVNFFNPFVFVVWIGVIGAATARHGYDLDLASFLTGTLLGILSLDLTKVVFADRMVRFMKPNVLSAVLRIAGVVMVGFGAFLFLRAAGY